MALTNASVVTEDVKENNVKIAVNSIQQTAYVKRLSVFSTYGQNELYSYDSDNLYPQKAISIKQRSWALTSACKTLSDFITGDGWEDENLNKIEFSKSFTGYDLLRFVSDEKSVIGFALHVNYNISGQIVEVQKIDFENLRRSKKGTILYNHDWSKPHHREIIEYNAFNPSTVIEEIREFGIENYTGQVFYWTGCNKIYPLATFDAAMDSGQYQAETELFKLRNVQNDFSASGVFCYPKTMDTNAEFQAAKLNIKNNATGTNNAGRMIFVGVTPDQDLKAKDIWASFERSNVDKLFETQNAEAKETIFSVMRQPQILGAVTQGGGWPNMQEMQDAFEYYNSIVEQDRKEVEKAVKKIIEVSIWADQLKSVQILPKMLIKNGSSMSGVPESIAEGGIDEADRLRLESQAKLKGTVGGVDGILAIQEKVSIGITQYKAGLKILVEIYGFEEQTAKEILGDEKKIKNGTERSDNNNSGDQGV